MNYIAGVSQGNKEMVENAVNVETLGMLRSQDQMNLVEDGAKVLWSENTIQAAKLYCELN